MGAIFQPMYPEAVRLILRKNNTEHADLFRLSE